MFRWIRNHEWLPETALALFIFLSCSLTDFALQGTVGLLVSAGFAVSSIFIRRFTYLAGALFISFALVEIYLQLDPLIGGIAIALAVLFSASFAKISDSFYVLGGAAISGVIVLWQACFQAELLQNIYGLSIYNTDGRWVAFALLSASNLVLMAFAWLLGRWLITSYNERTLVRERTAVNDKQLSLAIDLAEQSERFGIARDLNLVVSQQVSSMVALVDGARYAARIEPEVAIRTLDRLSELLRESHVEMRHLNDALSRSVSVQPAPPNIFDLDALMVQYRELGYNAKLVHQGQQLSLVPAAELAIYRIVFDSLENVRKHAPVGCSIDIDFLWKNEGLQVLIKDNGVEFRTKAANPKNSFGEGHYNANDDLEALVAEIDGVGITAMRERCELIGGSLEAKVVPGVGFTVSAIFPTITDLLNKG